MKIPNIVWIIGGIAAALYISNLGIAGATAQFVFNGVTFNSPTNWTISIVAQNVSNANVSINSMAGNVTLNGTSVGNFSFFPAQPLLVNANSQMNIPITFQPSILGVTSEVASAITSGTTNYSFEVAGNANVNGLVIPFDINNTVNVSALATA